MHNLEADVIKAAIFDLDGVITETADLHACAWKQMFDAFLQKHYPTQQSFDMIGDYRRYVDGKPREMGVKGFLESRGILLRWGEPEDTIEDITIVGLGNHKNYIFNQLLHERGVKVFPSTVQLIETLRNKHIKTAVVSSSKNCQEILEAVHLNHLFNAQVDGKDAARLRLNGKPEPDTFLYAADLLEVSPREVMVFEDALSGVQAAKAGKFRIVVGINRDNQGLLLKECGADIVVSDLIDLELGDLPVPLQPASSEPLAHREKWKLVYDAFIPEEEKVRETLCTLGNGYFSTRGASEESHTDAFHYPGVYIAGLYNRLSSSIGRRTVENEDVVNLPNWLCLTFRIDDGPWFHVDSVQILSYRQELDLHKGFLQRIIRFQDSEGRISTLHTRRIVSRKDQHIGAIRYMLTAENWSGVVTFQSALDGRVVNNNVKWYEGLSNKHLQPLRSNVIDHTILFLKMQTSQSEIRVAQAARHRIFKNNSLLALKDLPGHADKVEPDYVSKQLMIHLSKGDTLAVEKTMAMYCSRDRAISECGEAAIKAVKAAPDFPEMLLDQTQLYYMLWHYFDIKMRFNQTDMHYHPLMILRLHIFHLLQTVSTENRDYDVGIPPRGWHGEGYRGHIFWDETFIFPFLNFRLPDISRSLLMYRFRRLNQARIQAKAAGFRGAMYPWESASNGEETVPPMLVAADGIKWIPCYTTLQYHVNADIVYNIWEYYQTTHDMEFISFQGAEMIFEIARFWASVANYNAEIDRYEIQGIMGPDEYHSHYPHSNVSGINNNAYTNVMVVWVMNCALKLLDILPQNRIYLLKNLLDIQNAEIDHWREMSLKMKVLIDANGIIQQFEGYDQLKEIDLKDYEQKYGDLQLIEKYLLQEGKDLLDYKISKQADVLMLFYLFSAEELEEIFQQLGYSFDHAMIPKNIDYYLKRTAHGSSLSRVVHSWVAARCDRRESWRLFEKALQCDVSNLRAGSTAEGIHLGAMAGTVDLVLRGYPGIVTRDDILWFDPILPDAMEELSFQLHYRRQTLFCRFTKTHATISVCPTGSMEAIQFGFIYRIYTIRPGESKTFELNPEFKQNFVEVNTELLMENTVVV